MKPFIQGICRGVILRYPGAKQRPECFCHGWLLRHGPVRGKIFGPVYRPEESATTGLAAGVLILLALTKTNTNDRQEEPIGAGRTAGRERE